ncbi:MAG: NAD-dependent epimerase/dehydratase family protein, partial [Acidobacteriota bacterium]
ISKKNFTWVRASLSLVEAVSRFGAKRVVIAGTCAEYDWRDGWCSEEATPLKPITPYGIAKHSLHQELEAFAAKTRLSAAWGRIFFAYGPHERPERFVPSMVLSLLKGQAAVCLHGALLRDFLHVSDIADAFVALLESEICGPVNIASGRPVSLREIATRIASELDGHHLMRFESAADTPDEPPLIAGNVHRLSRELGWSPRYDLNRGLAQTIEWWRRHLRGGGSSPTSTA